MFGFLPIWSYDAIMQAVVDIMKALNLPTDLGQSILGLMEFFLYIRSLIFGG